MTTLTRSIVLAIGVLLMAPVVADIAPLTQDTFIIGSQPNANKGSNSTIAVQASAPKHGLLQFDTSAFSGTVSSATLTLNVTKVNAAGQVDVYPIASTWSESSVTFNTMPGLGSMLTSFAVSAADVGSTVSFDITALAQDWIDGTANFGIVLISAGANVKFGTKEGGLGAMLDVELGMLEKPNFATVEKSGGDYNDPNEAIDDLNEWCFQPAENYAQLGHESENCVLRIGPGSFGLSKTLQVPMWVDVIGAGPDLTEIFADQACCIVIMSRHGTGPFPPGISQWVGGNKIANMRVRIDHGRNMSAHGFSGAFADEGLAANTLKNLDIVVRHPTSTAIGVGGSGTIDGIGATYESINIDVEGGSASGMLIGPNSHTSNIRIVVRGGSVKGAILGPPGPGVYTFTDFDIDVAGDSAWGIRCAVNRPRIWNGTIRSNDIALRLTGSAIVQDVRIDAPVAVSVVDLGNTGDTNIELTDVYLLDALSNNEPHHNEIRFDEFPLASAPRLQINNTSGLDITGVPEATIQIGNSDVRSLISNGATIKCANTHDENYGELSATCTP